MSAADYELNHLCPDEQKGLVVISFASSTECLHRKIPLRLKQLSATNRLSTAIRDIVAPIVIKTREHQSR